MTLNTEQPSADEQEVGTEGDTAGGDAVGGDVVGGDAVGGDVVGGDAVGGDAVESDADESDVDEEERRSTGGDASHLDDLEDGAGCTEIWEKLSENRK